MQRLFMAAALLCAVAFLLIPSSSSAAGGSRIFAMMGENGSGENGAVILTPLGSKTRVQVAVANGPAGVIQPAHIHAGACPNVGKVVYPIKGGVVDGGATVVLDVPIDTLLAGGLALNVHKSADQISVYTSCADIKSSM